MIDIVVSFLARSPPLRPKGLVMVGEIEGIAHGLTSPRGDFVNVAATTDVVARARPLVRKRLELRMKGGF